MASAGYISKCSVPSRSDLPFLISDIRALWRSALSARVPEYQKLKMVGQTWVAKCNQLTSLPFKGLSGASRFAIFNKYSIRKMTMTSFAITLYGRLCVVNAML